MLTPAAWEAAKQGRYRPTLLDEDSVEVVPDVRVLVGLAGPGVVEVAPSDPVLRVGRARRDPFGFTNWNGNTEQARDDKLQGIGVLSCEIGPDGITPNIQLQKWLGLGLYEKTVQALERWRFRSAP